MRWPVSWRRCPLRAGLRPLRGVDERVRAWVDREVSIGDYVLTGGELPALVVIDAVSRLVPGVIDPASSAGDSFATGLLEHPQYTRPEEFEGVIGPADPLVGQPRRGRRLAPPSGAPSNPRAPPGPAGVSPLTDADRAELDAPARMRAPATDARWLRRRPLLYCRAFAAAPAVASLRQPSRATRR